MIFRNIDFRRLGDFTTILSDQIESFSLVNCLVSEVPSAIANFPLLYMYDMLMHWFYMSLLGLIITSILLQ